MIDRNLLDILVCPETLQPLRQASESLVARLNARIAEGSLLDRSERRVLDRLDGLLVRTDQKYAYAVRNQVPALLREEGIPLSPDAPQ